MQVKSVRTVVPNTAAGANSVLGTGSGASANKIVTQGDDNAQRHLRGVRISGILELVHLQIRASGAPIYDIETGAYAAAAGVIPLDYLYQPGVLFEATIFNDSAAAYNGHAVELIYDLPGT